MPFYVQMGRATPGKIPNSETMTEMWELVNKTRLEQLGLKPRQTDGTTSEDEKNGKTERKAPKLVKDGGAQNSSSSDPADDDELIMRDLRAGRKAQN